MKTTYHIQSRMNQRGITKAMIQYVLDFGDIQQDKYFISQDLANAYIRQIKKELSKRYSKHS